MKNKWILERFAAVDRKDIDGFIDMLSEDHQFIFGARPPVVGKADARTVVNYFWTLIGRLRHNIWRVREAGSSAHARPVSRRLMRVHSEALSSSKWATSSAR